MDNAKNKYLKSILYASHITNMTILYERDRRSYARPSEDHFHPFGVDKAICCTLPFLTLHSLYKREKPNQQKEEKKVNYKFNH